MNKLCLLKLMFLKLPYSCAKQNRVIGKFWKKFLCGVGGCFSQHQQHFHVALSTPPFLRLSIHCSLTAFLFPKTSRTSTSTEGDKRREDWKKREANVEGGSEEVRNRTAMRGRQQKGKIKKQQHEVGSEPWERWEWDTTKSCRTNTDRETTCALTSHKTSSSSLITHNPINS